MAGVIKCKAAVMWEKGADLVIEEIEVAPPRAGEVSRNNIYRWPVDTTDSDALMLIVSHRCA